MAVMAKKKKPGNPGPKKDRHLPHKMVRVPLDVYEQFSKLADRNDRSISRELRRLMIEELKRQGLWPPAEGGGEEGQA